MTKRKPHIKDLQCFKEVADVIGEVKAQEELWKVVHYLEDVYDFDKDMELVQAFLWRDTPQGKKFWSRIDDGDNPYTGNL